MGQNVRDLLGATVISVPLANKVTDNGIITSLDLESAVLFGLTWGAWFHVGTGIALTLLIVERGLSIKNKLTSRRVKDGRTNA